MLLACNYVTPMLLVQSELLSKLDSKQRVKKRCANFHLHESVMLNNKFYMAMAHLCTTLTSTFIIFFERLSKICLVAVSLSVSTIKSNLRSYVSLVYLDIMLLYSSHNAIISAFTDFSTSCLIFSVYTEDITIYVTTLSLEVIVVIKCWYYSKCYNNK